MAGSIFLEAFSCTVSATSNLKFCIPIRSYFLFLDQSLLWLGFFRKSHLVSLNYFQADYKPRIRFWLFPDNPVKCKFLVTEEKVMVVEVKYIL